MACRKTVGLCLFATIADLQALIRANKGPGSTPGPMESPVPLFSEIQQPFCVFLEDQRTNLVLDRNIGESLSQRSVSSPASPIRNSILCFSSELAYCTRIGGKYFGDHPTCRCRHSACGWRRRAPLPAMGRRGARDDRHVGEIDRDVIEVDGFENFSRIAMPPRRPAPKPLSDRVESVIAPSSAIAS